MDTSVDTEPTRRRRLRRLAVAAAGIAAAATLAGCSADQLQRGYLPEESQGATDVTDRITNLWVGSWVAALILGVLVWGLTLWVIVAYRRRRSDAPLPPQFRYHVPIEVMYTAVPTVVVLVLFYFTAQDQAVIMSLDDDEEVDLQVEVIGKQWSWDFNYLDYDVYSTGEQAGLEDPEGVDDRLPVLYLPAGERVEFILYSRDVNHSLWIPAFLFKMDTIVGRENRFRVTPLEEGEYAGRCAELCGEWHAEMLFRTVVLPPDEFEAEMANLAAAGQTGRLEVELGRGELNEDADGGGVRGTGDEDARPQDPGSGGDVEPDDTEE